MHKYVKSNLRRKLLTNPKDVTLYMMAIGRTQAKATVQILTSPITDLQIACFRIEEKEKKRVEREFEFLKLKI